MAKRFIFRLETVRRLRQLDVERRQRALAEAIHRVRDLDNYIGDLNRELRETMLTDRGHQERTTLDVAQLRSGQLHGGWLRKQVLVSREELSRREKRVDEERRKLQDADKRLKVIEKLKERHATRHRELVHRAEQAETDEVGTQLFVRRPSSPLPPRERG